MRERQRNIVAGNRVECNGCGQMVPGNEINQWDDGCCGCAEEAEIARRQPEGALPKPEAFRLYAALDERRQELCRLIYFSDVHQTVMDDEGIQGVAEVWDEKPDKIRAALEGLVVLGLIQRRKDDDSVIYVCP